LSVLSKNDGGEPQTEIFSGARVPTCIEPLKFERVIGRWGGCTRIPKREPAQRERRAYDEG